MINVESTDYASKDNILTQGSSNTRVLIILLPECVKLHIKLYKVTWCIPQIQSAVTLHLLFFCPLL